MTSSNPPDWAIKDAEELVHEHEVFHIGSNRPRIIRRIANALHQAVLRERETCLKIVEDQKLPFNSISNEAACIVRDIIQAIRNLSIGESK